MKAILLRRPGGPEALEYVEVPTPVPGEGKVLVKADYVALRLDQLAGDAHAISRLPDASLQHVAHAQFAPDLPDIESLALVGEARMARDHEQPFDPRQTGDDVLDHAVAEVFLIRIAAHILEWQHGNRRFVGQRRRRSRWFCTVNAQPINPHRMIYVL